MQIFNRFNTAGQIVLPIAAKYFANKYAEKDLGRLAEHLISLIPTDHTRFFLILTVANRVFTKTVETILPKSCEDIQGVLLTHFATLSCSSVALIVYSSSQHAYEHGIRFIPWEKARVLIAMVGIFQTSIQCAYIWANSPARVD